jgi:hypothetical protein
MEELLAAFSTHCSLLPASVHINNYLYLRDDNNVYTSIYIPANTVLGEIYGVIKNYFEVNHTQYMVLNDERVLDISEQILFYETRDIITFIAQDNWSWNHVNCVIERNDEGRFYMKTTKPIDVHQELVYMTDL